MFQVVVVQKYNIISNCYSIPYTNNMHNNININQKKLFNDQYLRLFHYKE